MQTVIAPDGVYLPALGRPVEADDKIELDDDVAASLIEQGWQSQRSVAAKEAAARKKAKATDADAATNSEPAAAGEEE